MLKLFLVSMLFASLFLVSQTSYATSQNAFGHAIINPTILKLKPSFGVTGTHVQLYGKGFIPYYILDVVFTDSHNHVFKMGKILVNKHGDFVKRVIIPKNTSIGHGVISVKHGSVILNSGVFNVIPKHHESHD